VIEVLRERGVSARLATPGEAGEQAWLPAGEAAPLRLPAAKLPRRLGAWPGFVPALASAVGWAAGRLRRWQPGVVVGLGGWPCVPAALAAPLVGCPLALVASDERPGVAVRRLAPLARRIYVAMPEAAARLGGGPRVVLTGPVLRRGVATGRRDPRRFGLREGRATLLVTGGSLGARVLNERLARGLEAAVRADPTLVDRIQVLHSVGRSGAGVADAYARVGLVHHVTPFLRDMATAYATADLVVCRAGALTCAEIESAGLSAVLVPYPHHADRQQYANARRLVEGGRALLLEEEALDAEDAVVRIVLPRLEAGRRAPRGRRPSAHRPEEGTDSIAADLVRLLEGRPRCGKRRGTGGRPKRAPARARWSVGG